MAGSVTFLFIYEAKFVQSSSLYIFMFRQERCLFSVLFIYLQIGWSENKNVPLSI